MTNENCRYKTGAASDTLEEKIRLQLWMLECENIT
jgi:hypothetical protein